LWDRRWIDPHTYAGDCWHFPMNPIRGALSLDSIISGRTCVSPLCYLGRRDPSLSRGLWTCTIELWYNVQIQGVFEAIMTRLQGFGASFAGENVPNIYSPSRGVQPSLLAVG
jgi:hypothetical protein